MKNPELNLLLQNVPNSLLARVEQLEQQVQELQVSELPGMEQVVDGKAWVIDLLLFPSEGVTVTDPTSTDYIGGFISSEGYDFGGTLYNMGGVNAGVIQFGVNTADGTLYAINANISGVFTVGAGSTAGGWVIDSDSIHDAAGTVGLSSAVTGGNDLRIWAGSATPASAPFRVYEDGSLFSTLGSIGGWTIGTTAIQDTAGLTGMSSAVTGGNDIRFWAGHATPGSAPFQVFEDGAVIASAISIAGASTIAGWNIDTTRIYKFSTGSVGVILDSSIPAIKIGDTAGTYILVDGANQVIKSSNYSAGLIGSAWTTSTGDAEFNNITARGALKVTAIQASTVMAHGGTDWIVPAVGVLRDDCTSVDSPTTFAINIKDPDGLIHVASGNLWAVGDLIRLKEPLTGDLWASISSLTDNTTYWTLNVVKQSPGAGTNYTFRKGLAIINYGASGAGFIALSADTSVGSTPNITMATHAGSPWSTFTTLTRIGNLNGSYGYVANTYGMGIGSYGVASQTSLTIETTNGFRILNNTTVIGQWSAAGVITVGEVASGKSNVQISAGALKLRNNTTDVIVFDTTESRIDNLLKMSGASAALSLGTTPPTSATVGTGLWIDRTGVYSLSSSTQNATLTSTGFTAASGNFVADSSGVSLAVPNSFNAANSYRFLKSGVLTSYLYTNDNGSLATGGFKLNLSASGANRSYPAHVELICNSKTGYLSDITISAAATGGALAGIVLSSPASAPGSITINSTNEDVDTYINGNGGEIVRFDGSALSAIFTGTAYIGDTANANSTLGLTINQGAADNEIFSLKSSDIAHGITDVTETDTYGFFAKDAPTVGGLQITGLSEGAVTGMNLIGIVTTSVTSKNTSSVGALVVNGKLKSGTGVASLGANGNIIAFRDNGTTRFILDADGDSHQDVGTAWTNFSTHDDPTLLTHLSVLVSRPDDPIRNMFGEILQEHRQELEELKLVKFNDDGHHFVNMSKLLMLNTGASMQNARKLIEFEKRLELLEKRLLSV